MLRINDLIDFDKLEYKWNIIETIPEFAVLKTCEQSKKWHKEGNVFIHTKKVCEEAVKICKKSYLLNMEERLLLTSALFHDIGKGVTTKQDEQGNWHSYSHEIEGEKITRFLLWDEGYSFREYVCSLVRYHMLPLNLLDSNVYLERIVYLSKVLPSWQILIMLKTCDILGSEQENDDWKNIDIRKLHDIEDITLKMNCFFNASLINRKEEFSYVKHVRQQSHNKSIDAYVLIGLPGAGKTRSINKLVNELSPNTEHEIVSRDIIRAEIGLCKEGDKIVGTKEEENRISDIFNKKMLDAAEEGKVLIIDNLNTKVKYRNNYKHTLYHYNVTWHYMYVEAETLTLNIERRKGQISPDVFKNIILNFDWPVMEEYDDIQFLLTNNSE